MENKCQKSLPQRENDGEKSLNRHRKSSKCRTNPRKRDKIRLNLLTYMGVFGLWFSGVFANTVHLVQMICIPLESSDHGRCFYVPFIQTRASPGSSLVQDKVFITFWEVSVLMCLFTYFLHKIQCSLDISNERKSCYMQYNSCAWVAQLFNTKVTALMNFTSVHQDNYF